MGDRTDIEHETSRSTLVSVRPFIGRTEVEVLVGITALLGFAFVVTLGINRHLVEIPELKLMFDMGREANIPTWWNSLLLAGIAAVMLLAALLNTGGERPTPRSLVVAALAVTYLSIDEAAELHEMAGEPTNRILDRAGVEFDSYAWVIPGALVALVALVVFVRWSRTLPTAVRRSALIGLALYATGALGVEWINGWLRDRDEYLYVAGTLTEETLEILACIVAIHGFARLVEVHETSERRSIQARRFDEASPSDVGH